MFEGYRKYKNNFFFKELKFIFLLFPLVECFRLHFQVTELSVSPHKTNLKQ